MKYLIFLFLLVLWVPAQGQITLEHKYNQPGDIGLVEVDSGNWKYVVSSNDTIQIYNIDHSLERVISMPVNARLQVIAKRLFDTDTDYCYLAAVPGKSSGGLAIFNAKGTLLFSRDSCYLGTSNTNVVNQIASLGGIFPPAIKSTPQGTKMIVWTTFSNNAEVYSLPGKLPGCQTARAGVNPTITFEDNAIPTSAYPNPTNGAIRIAYQLPVGVFSGEIVVISETGIAMKHYRVTSAFNDLLIDGIEFPSGSYFYKLVTDKGTSTTGKFTVSK